jgi:ABC-type transport system involved in multi-copper enzyme maturation permease subunit
MSTTTEPVLAPPEVRPIETAPSQTLAQGPALARMVGFAGLFALVLGAVVIITNMALSPRWITTGWGYLFAAVGIVLLMYHAVSDTEPEIRRMYGLFSAVWLLLAVAAAVIPGPVFSPAAEKKVGFNLLPWGVGFGFISLLFAIPFARQETDKTYRSYAVLAMLGIGSLLAVGSLLAGIANKDFLAGPGLALALLGLAFLAAYMGQVDTSEGIGYQVAFLLGAVGAAVALGAFAYATVPTLLFEGPNVLRKPNGELDSWRVAARVLVVLIFGGIAVAGWKSRSAPSWLRSTLVAIGAAGVIILLVASFKANTITQPPAPFLVPNGLILMGLGIVYLAVALGICSDNQLITLTRRELASYFLSPIGYLVLGGTTLMQWLSYNRFIGSTILAAGAASQPIQEPIVAGYWVDIFPVFAMLLQIPVITMRLIAEEKRTGSLEVLLTAPINDWPVVVSKYVATVIFFLISWLPAGLFLIALRVEGGQPFDYRPLLSFYIALAAEGLAFVAIGLFFSSLTRNQIVAAVLTLVVMIAFLMAYFVRVSPSDFGLPSYLSVFVGRFSFVHMWIESLNGRLPLKDTILYASLGVFFLFLSVKVLEARKWN